MIRPVQYLLALFPLLATPALVYALAEGWINLGGGEKDLILTIPYMLWALLFFIISVVLIIKGWSPGRWLGRSIGLSIFLMLILWIIAFAMSWWGIL